MDPHFRTQWSFHFKNEKPSRKRFLFPESGFRRLPMAFVGTESGLNTVQLNGLPHLKLSVGDVMELDCTTISYEHLHHYIQIGSPVALWDGDFFADGTIIKIYNLP